MWALEVRNQASSPTIREVANAEARRRCARFHRPPERVVGVAHFRGDPNLSPVRNLANGRANQYRVAEHPAAHLAGVR